jgi:HEAT repeat protein
MAKLRSVDAKLSRLRALRQEVATQEHLADLRHALADKSNLVVADAAEIAGERLLSDLAPDLVDAFNRFMVEPAENDKLCRAKIAIVTALNKMEYDKEDVFLRGIRHVQMEPRWGGSEDSAAPLRANAAFGLVRMNHRDVLLLLADLLADPEKVARSAAAQALGETRAAAAIPLLRFKARTGDEEPEVTAECLAALLRTAPKESLPFVAQFLDSRSEAIQEGAAFALGESRWPDALAILTSHWPKARHGSLQEALLLAISMTRLPAAIDFLLELLTDDNQAHASGALSALTIHRHNGPVKERIAAVVAKKGDAALQDSFKKKFDAKQEEPDR